MPDRPDRPDSPLHSGRDNPRDPFDALQAARNVDLSNLMSKQVEVLASMSERVRDSFQGIADLIGKTTDRLDRTATAANRVTKATRDQAAAQIEVADYAQKRADSEEKIAEAIAKGSTALRGQMRSTGMYERGMYRYMDEEGKPRSLTEDQFAAALADPNSKAGRAIKEQLANRMSLGQGADNKTFNIGQILGSLASGNFTGALGEFAQRIPGAWSEKIVGRAETKGASMMGGGGISKVIGAVLPKLASFALSPAAILGVEQAVSRGLGAYQGTLRQGLQVGLDGKEAISEVSGGRARAFAQGVNPFDALTRSAAMEIAGGVRGEGFTGPLQAAWQEAVGDIVNATGMSASESLDLMRFSTNELGLTVDQFRGSMSQLDNVARDTNLTVQTVAKSMRAFQSQTFKTGGREAAVAAGEVSNAFAAALPRDFVERGELDVLAAGQRQIAIMYGGRNPLSATGKEALAAYGRDMDAFVKQLTETQAANGMTGQDVLFAQTMVNTGALQNTLPNITVEGLVSILRLGRKSGGRGFEVAQRKSETSMIQDAKQKAERRGGVGGWLDRKLAKVTFKGAIPQFKEDIKSVVNLPFSGLSAEDILQEGRGSEARERKGQSAAISELGRQLTQKGYGKDQRAKILKGLRGSDNDEFDSRLSRTQEVVYKLELAGGAKTLFANPQRVQAYQQYITGGAGSQGSLRP